MSIVRPDLPFDRFTRVPNDWARDESLSYRARGLLVALLSHRPGWRITVAALVEGGAEGRDAVRSALNELVAAGYLQRARSRDDAGQYGETSWVITEPTSAPAPGNPSPGNPPSAHRPTKKTIEKKNPLPPSGEAPPLDGIEPEPPKQKPRRKATSALPPDWSPRPVDREKAPPGVDVDVEASKFRDHAEANDRRQVDWHAAFRLWLRRAGEYAAARPAGGRPPGQDVDPAKGADAWMYPERRTTYADYAPEATS